MDPWDFSGMNFDSGNSMPQMPPTQDPSQMDVPSMMAQQLAQRGIRPEQFMQNPQQAMAAVQPPQAQGGGGAGSNPWDPTPVSSVGGPPVDPRTVSPADASASTAVTPAQASLSTQTPSAMAQTGDPMAAGKPQDAQAQQRVQAFLNTLKGVQAPKPPTPQTIRTPAAPGPHAPLAVKPQLLALLQQLGASAGAGQAPRMPTLGPIR